MHENSFMNTPQQVDFKNNLNRDDMWESMSGHMDYNAHPSIEQTATDSIEIYADEIDVKYDQQQ